MPQKDKLPKFSIRRHGRQFYVRFYFEGRRYERPVGRIEETSEEAANREGEKTVAAVVAQFKRAMKRREKQNPLPAAAR